MNSSLKTFLQINHDSGIQGSGNQWNGQERGGGCNKQEGE